MIDVVAVTLNKQGGVTWVLSAYVPDDNKPKTYSLTKTRYYPEQKRVPTIPVSKIGMSEYRTDPVALAQWELPGKYNKAALRFQSDEDLARMPMLKTPPGTVTFMDTPDYEAWLVMLAMADWI